MTKVRLTDVSLRQLSPGDGQTRYFDLTTPGFGVTVGKRTKTFFVIRGKERRLTTIGKYPDISLQDARREAKRLLVADPSKLPAKPLTEAVEAYLRDCEGRLRPRTIEEYARPLRKGPAVLLSDLTRDQIDVDDPHTLAAWKVFLNWCVRHEYLDRNPLQHDVARYGQRSRVLTDDEIVTIMAYDAPPFSHILKLCLLTGQRKGEVTQFCPEWIRDDTITIPAAVAKNGHEHVIPFNLLTAKYLREYQHQSFNGFSKAKARFDTLHPMPHWTIHDLRRTFATIHARLGTPIHVVEAMLNHRSGTISGVAAIYVRHSFLEEARQAALKYETHIAKLISA